MNESSAVYHIRLEQFSGPLEKLLELIEARKLDITELSLSQVTDDFLKYLGTLREVEPGGEAGLTRLLADFVAVASRLLYIKSKALLPDLTLTTEEQAEIKELTERLKWYRELKPAMRNIQGLWRLGHKSFGRPYFLHIAGASGVFYPGSNLEFDRLKSALNRLFEGLERFTLESETIKERVITLEEKINEIVRRIKELAQTTFSKLAHGTPRHEAIVTFLALLHLAREQMILLKQSSHLSDIIVTKVHKS